MADPLSLTASIIAIIAAVKNGANTVILVYNIQNDLKNLQHELNELELSVCSLQRCAVFPKSESQPLQQTLQRAHALITQLHEFFIRDLYPLRTERKLLQVFVWRYRTKIHEYQQHIKQCQQSLENATMLTVLYVSSALLALHANAA